MVSRGITPLASYSINLLTLQTMKKEWCHALLVSCTGCTLVWNTGIWPAREYVKRQYVALQHSINCKYCTEGTQNLVKPHFRLAPGAHVWRGCARTSSLGSASCSSDRQTEHRNFKCERFHDLDVLRFDAQPEVYLTYDCLTHHWPKWLISFYQHSPNWILTRVWWVDRCSLKTQIVRLLSIKNI